jgi:putative sulfotransferase
VVDGKVFWSILSNPDSDAANLIRLGFSVPELLVDSERLHSPSARIPPLLLIPLPHLSEEPERLHRALEAMVVSMPSRPAAEHFAHIFDWLCTQIGRRTWIERSGGSSHYADLLVSNFPDARFIHLVRDGRETAVSMSRHPYFRLRLARFLAKDPKLSVELAMSTTIPIDRFGAFWSSLMIHANRMLQTVPPERVLVLRYERWVEQPDHEWTRLARFCELSEHLPANLGSWMKPPSRTSGTLSASDYRALDRACLPGQRVLAKLERLCV